MVGVPLSISTNLKARTLGPLLSLGAMPGVFQIPLSTIAMQLRAWRVVRPSIDFDLLPEFFNRIPPKADISGRQAFK